MLTFDNVTLGYGPIQAVRNLSLHVGEGQIVALLGRNGAGKTTSLRGAIGLNKVRKGSVVVAGSKISHLTVDAVCRLGLQYVPEGRGVFPGLSLKENLAVAAYGAGMTRRTAAAEISRVLQLFPGIADRGHQLLGTMSGGQQQMAVIARALLPRPRLLLVDEPGLGLAPVIVHELYELLATLNREDGLSVLLVEQYVDLALQTSHHVYVLDKGEVAAFGRCEDSTTRGKVLAQLH
jgi:branched-chain amino acid transport system ATP-binding protein